MVEKAYELKERGENIVKKRESGQMDNILEVVLSLASLNFGNKAELTGESDQLDSLAASINMLGEELRAKVVLLDERDRFLKEIHHRVKNNLQIVSSILNLQANSFDDPKISQKFLDCRDRINSIALVHEQLYQADNLDLLEINGFFSSLSMRLHKIHERDGVSFNFIGFDKAIYLSVDKIIPLGILCSELITNSFKHAFDDTREGVIGFEIRREADQLIIRISDNGKGMEDPGDFFNSDSLGLQLVHALIGQLEAAVEFKPRKPFEVTLRMKLL